MVVAVGRNIVKTLCRECDTPGTKRAPRADDDHRLFNSGLSRFVKRVAIDVRDR
jgi:hypothetical protein